MWKIRKTESVSLYAKYGMFLERKKSDKLFWSTDPVKGLGFPVKEMAEKWLRDNKVTNAEIILVT